MLLSSAKNIVYAESSLATLYFAQSHELRQQMCVSDDADSLAADSGRSSTESLLSRSSPVGMSPQVQEPAPSLSASLGSAETLCDDDVPPIPLDTYRDGVLQSATAILFTESKSIAKCESFPVSFFLSFLLSKPQALQYL